MCVIPNQFTYVLKPIQKYIQQRSLSAICVKHLYPQAREAAERLRPDRQVPFVCIGSEKKAKVYDDLAISESSVADALIQFIADNEPLEKVRQASFAFDIKDGNSLDLIEGGNIFTSPQLYGQMRESLRTNESLLRLLLFKACLVRAEVSIDPLFLSVLAYPIKPSSPAFSTHPHNDGILGSILSVPYIHPSFEESNATLRVGAVVPGLSLRGESFFDAHISIGAAQSQDIGVFRQEATCSPQELLSFPLGPIYIGRGKYIYSLYSESPEYFDVVAAIRKQSGKTAFTTHYLDYFNIPNITQDPFELGRLAINVSGLYPGANTNKSNQRVFYKKGVASAEKLEELLGHI